MYKDPSAIVKMHGPSISDPSKIVNRDVHQRDVQAYKAAGYKEGSIQEIVYTEAQAIVHNDGEDVNGKKPKKKSK